MNYSENKTVYLIAGALVVLFLMWNMLGGAATLGSAASGIPANVATSTNITVTTAASAFFATTTNCVSRTISTVQPIMLTFSDINGATPTAVLGNIQGASTTVSYDAGLYGCGLFKGISASGASGNVTVTEYR